MLGVSDKYMLCPGPLFATNGRWTSARQSTSQHVVTSARHSTSSVEVLCVFGVLVCLVRAWCALCMWCAYTLYVLAVAFVYGTTARRTVKTAEMSYSKGGYIHVLSIIDRV
jgi:hypothetical protein